MKGIAFVSVLVALGGLVLCIAIGMPRQLETGFISGIGILTQGEVGSAEDTKTGNKMSEEGKGKDKTKGAQLGAVDVGKVVDLTGLSAMPDIDFVIGAVRGGTVAIGDLTLSVREADGAWFARHGIKGNGIVVGQNVDGQEVTSIVIRSDVSAEDKKAALAHELPVAIALEGGVDAAEETALIDRMGVDAAEVAMAAMDRLVPDAEPVVLNTAPAVPLLTANLAPAGAGVGVMIGAETGPIDVAIEKSVALANGIPTYQPGAQLAAQQRTELNERVDETLVASVAPSSQLVRAADGIEAFYFGGNLTSSENIGLMGTFALARAGQGYKVYVVYDEANEKEKEVATILARVTPNITIVAKADVATKGVRVGRHMDENNIKNAVFVTDVRDEVPTIGGSVTTINYTGPNGLVVKYVGADDAGRVGRIVTSVGQALEKA